MGKSLSRRDTNMAPAWEEFTPFLRFPPELRKVVYTTNVARTVTKTRGHQ